MYKTVLVNKENKIKDNFLNRIELISFNNSNNKKILIEKNTYKAYLKLKDYLEKKEIFIDISSAYRTYQEQQEIIDEATKRYGKELRDNVVSPVGNSEHHTGLAIDLTISEENKENYQILNEALWEFGFILRYPKNKEKITGYNYNPLHIRYVSSCVAKIIHDNNWTLEEYKNNFSGVIAVNKPKGVTSFDVVNDISHIFGIKKVGHTGTLDPLAEGVLIVAIGKATKIVELLTAADKEYIASVQLGIKTDTYDITGNVVARKEIPETINIKETLESFQKTYLQEVPIYSAIKVNGKKLYEYARNNKPVELPKKEVTIKNIELLESTKDTFKFRALVTKGTYIRSLINDIGISLSSFATMTSLQRTKQGTISLENTYTLEDIKNNNYKIYSIEEALDYPVIIVDKSLEFKISNGQKIENNYNIKDKVIFKTKEKSLGIYESDGNNLKVWKNFV